MQDARDGAGLVAIGAREAREERVERVAARILDGHRAQRPAHDAVDLGQRRVRLDRQRVVDGRRVLGGREGLLARDRASPVGGSVGAGCVSSADAAVSHGKRAIRSGAQLRRRVGDGERRDHHEQRARRLPEKRVLTQSHIDRRGGYADSERIGSGTFSRRRRSIPSGPRVQDAGACEAGGGSARGAPKERVSDDRESRLFRAHARGGTGVLAARAAGGRERVYGGRSARPRQETHTDQLVGVRAMSESSADAADDGGDDGPRLVREQREEGAAGRPAGGINFSGTASPVDLNAGPLKALGASASNSRGPMAPGRAHGNAGVAMRASPVAAAPRPAQCTPGDPLCSSANAVAAAHSG